MFLDVNWFIVSVETGLCFWNLACVFESDLCFRIFVCVFGNLFVFDPFGPPYLFESKCPRNICFLQTSGDCGQK